MSQLTVPRRPKVQTQRPAGDHAVHATTVPTQTVNTAEMTRYVAEMCSDLTNMASSAGLPMLTYLLSMARQEAERIYRGLASGERPAGSRHP